MKLQIDIDLDNIDRGIVCENCNDYYVIENTNICNICFLGWKAIAASDLYDALKAVKNSGPLWSPELLTMVNDSLAKAEGRFKNV